MGKATLLKDVPVPNSSNKTLTIRIPRENELTPEAWSAIRSHVVYVTDRKLASMQHELNVKPSRNNEIEHIDFEGNFGSQDPALQVTAEDKAALSRYFQALKRGLSHEEAAHLADFRNR